MEIVDSGQMLNCPVTRRDVNVAEAIFGPDEGILKGKTIYKPGSPIKAETVTLPPHIMNFYKDVVISADIMKINGIAFFMSISRNLLFGTAERISNNQVPTLQTSLKQIHRFYMQRGFRPVEYIRMDNLFQWRVLSAGNSMQHRIWLPGVHMLLRLSATIVLLKNGLDVYTMCYPS